MPKSETHSEYTRRWRRENPDKVKAYIDEKRTRRNEDRAFRQQEKEWQRKWKSTLSEEARQRQLERQNSSRREWKIHAFDFFGWECVDCGETDINVIDFDHIPGRGEKKAAPARLSGEKFFYEVTNKCEPVCANCHRRRTRQRLIDGTAAHLIRRRTGIPEKEDECEQL